MIRRRRRSRRRRRFSVATLVPVIILLVLVAQPEVRSVIEEDVRALLDRVWAPDVEQVTSDDRSGGKAAGQAPGTGVIVRADGQVVEVFDSPPAFRNTSTLAARDASPLSPARPNARARAATDPPQGLSRARVVDVTDGDTLVVVKEGERHRVRLDGIDVPEAQQPGGGHATQALEKLTLGRQVRLLKKGQDRYGRILARVMVDGQDVSAALVRDGHAWHYSDDDELSRLERQARDRRAGLWAEPDPIPPWQWRRENR